MAVGGSAWRRVLGMEGRAAWRRAGRRLADMVGHAADDAQVALARRPSLAERLFGHDLAVVFAHGPARRDTLSYASDLTRRLREAGASVAFCDRLPVTPDGPGDAADGVSDDDALDPATRRRLDRSAALVVVVDRRALDDPLRLRAELAAYRRRHPERPVIPITLDDGLNPWEPPGPAGDWHGFRSPPGTRDVIVESADAVRLGIAGDGTVRELLRLTRPVRRFGTHARARALALGAGLALLASVGVGVGHLADALRARDDALQIRQADRTRQLETALGLAAARNALGEHAAAAALLAQEPTAPETTRANARLARFEAEMLVDAARLPPEQTLDIDRLHEASSGGRARFVSRGWHSGVNIIERPGEPGAPTVVRSCDLNTDAPEIRVASDGSWFALRGRDGRTTELRTTADCAGTHPQLSRWAEAILRRESAGERLTVLLPLPGPQLLLGWADGRIERLVAGRLAANPPGAATGAAPNTSGPTGPLGPLGTTSATGATGTTPAMRVQLDSAVVGLFASPDATQIAALSQRGELRLFGADGRPLAAPIALQPAGRARTVAPEWRRFVRDAFGPAPRVMRLAPAAPTGGADRIELLVARPEPGGASFYVQRPADPAAAVLDVAFDAGADEACPTLAYLTREALVTVPLDRRCARPGGAGGSNGAGGTGGAGGTSGTSGTAGDDGTGATEGTGPPGGASAGTPIRWTLPRPDTVSPDLDHGYATGALCDGARTLVLGTARGELLWMRPVRKTRGTASRVEIEHRERSWNDAVATIVCRDDGSVVAGFATKGVKTFRRPILLREDAVPAAAATDYLQVYAEDQAWSVTTFRGIATLELDVESGEFGLRQGRFLWHRRMVEPAPDNADAPVDHVISVFPDEARARVWVLSTRGRLTLLDLDTGAELAAFGTSYDATTPSVYVALHRPELDADGRLSFVHRFRERAVRVVAGGPAGG